MRKLPEDERRRRKAKRDSDFYLAHREERIKYANEYGPKWRKRNPEKNRAIEIRHRRKLRVLALQSYGGKCACCGLEDQPFLSIDHINNDGARHRRQEKLKGSGYHLYAWLKKHNFPNGFQVLCYNCNLAKQHFGMCPHQMSPASRNLLSA